MSLPVPQINYRKVLPMFLSSSFYVRKKHTLCTSFPASKALGIWVLLKLGEIGIFTLKKWKTCKQTHADNYGGWSGPGFLSNKAPSPTGRNIFCI
jgi:hypothetical protein